MKALSGAKKFFLVTVFFLLVGISIWVARRAEIPGSRETPSIEDGKSDAPPSQGSLLSSGGTLLGAKSTSKDTGVVNAALSSRLQEIPLDPRIESFFRGSADRGDPVAAEFLSYLRLKHVKKEFTDDEMRNFSGQILPRLTENPDAALSLIAQALTAFDGSPDLRSDRLELMNLVAIFPPKENPEISRNAISTLASVAAERRSSDESVNSSTDALQMSIQAFLASTSADREGAHSALVSAMGGKVEPSIMEFYRGVMRERFPPKR